jgi:hypothetical protein
VALGATLGLEERLPFGDRLARKSVPRVTLSSAST